MSNLLLVLLWLGQEALREDVKAKFAHVGTVYTADAVNYIIKALYSDFIYVDTVIIFGPDYSGGGELIVKALEGECNEAVRVPCEYVQNLNVRTVDLRWRSIDELRSSAESLYKPRDSPARLRTNVPVEIPNRRNPYLGIHVIYHDDLDALKLMALDYLITYGVETRDVIYSIVALQRGGSGNYEVAPCDLLNQWPCGLDKKSTLVATPAYVEKNQLALPQLEIKPAYDPHGNFVISDKLYHYDSRGVLLRAIELTEYNIRREATKLHPDHAFYLGAEWAAYKILGEKYVQDKWQYRR